jgi:hypothetical protein
MGIAANVGYDQYPQQGSQLGARVEVCFHYDTSRTVGGAVVRDDNEEPYRQIIALDDGRYVLSTECMYHVER